MKINNNLRNSINNGSINHNQNSIRNTTNIVNTNKGSYYSVNIGNNHRLIHKINNNDKENPNSVMIDLD